MKIKIAHSNNRITIDLPMSDSDLNARMKSIGNNKIIPWCVIVSVIDEDNPLHCLEGCFVNLDEVNYFAKRMESFNDYEKSVMNAYVDENSVHTVNRLINLTYGIQGLSLITDFSNAEQVGRRLYLDEFLGMSEDESRAINFIEFAEKTFQEDSVKVLPYGVYVEHGFQMPEIYNGRTFPEYCNSDKIVMSLEIKNQLGDTDYLYLPTDKVAFEKLKARLEVNKFRECIVSAINNIKLPENLVPKVEELGNIRALTFLNEFCSIVEDFSEEKLKKLSMVVEYVKPPNITDYTDLARCLHDFEVVPNVHNDKQYGEYILIKSGLFDIDELVLPHIDYAAFAAEKRKSTCETSDYVSGGFVGASKNLEQYLNYTGAFADVLELNAEHYMDFCLYSPLTAEWSIDGRNEDTLHGRELLDYQDAIEDAVAIYSFNDPTRGLMHYYDDDPQIAEKVIIAKPIVKAINGELYGVLECKLAQGLTEEEVTKLKEYWTGQMSDGWGEGFEQQEIKLDEGELYVSFWSFDNSWQVYTEDELSEEQQQGIRMSY
ncbi:MAG: hypothetical protein J6B94_00580 [Lachnospiraceae bacterium]|nr:hypothetical protein [Lachnospiraceae bacterium]